MAWIVITAAEAASIQKTPICQGQQFSPIPLKDGTFYIDDGNPEIKAADKVTPTKATTQIDFDTMIKPLLIDPLLGKTGGVVSTGKA